MGAQPSIYNSTTSLLKDIHFAGDIKSIFSVKKEMPKLDFNFHFLKTLYQVDIEKSIASYISVSEDGMIRSFPYNTFQPEPVPKRSTNEDPKDQNTINQNPRNSTDENITEYSTLESSSFIDLQIPNANIIYCENLNEKQLILTDSKGIVYIVSKYSTKLTAIPIKTVSGYKTFPIDDNSFILISNQNEIYL